MLSRIRGWVFELGSWGRVDWSLIVEELQVVSALVPLVDLSVGARSQVLRCLFLRESESLWAGPVRLTLLELLWFEAFEAFKLCLVHQVWSRAHIKRCYHTKILSLKNSQREANCKKHNSARLTSMLSIRQPRRHNSFNSSNRWIQVWISNREITGCTATLS